MKNILVLAYCVSPSRGSEYSVAWNYITEMSKNNKLTVIFGASGDHMGDVDEVVNYAATHNMPNVTFVPVLPDKKALFLNQLNVKGILCYTFYFAFDRWNKLVYNEAIKMTEKESFDLVHYLGPIGYREPSYLWKLNIPYMWGPIGGANNIPTNLFTPLSLKSKLGFLFRTAANFIQIRYASRLRNAIKRTDLLLTATTENQAVFKKIHNKESVYLPENCIIPKLLKESNAAKYDNQTPLQLIFIGGAIAGKNLITLLRALGKIEDKSSFVLNVVGDVSEGFYLRKFVDENNLADSVKWHGKIPRDQVVELFSKAHLHCITSISEGNPTTIWEAMGSGVPTLTLDHCGMRDVVCEKCGIKVPIGKYNEMVDGLSQQISLCISNPDILKAKNAGVLECAKKYLWADRVKFIEDCYDKTISNFLNR